MLEIEAKFRVPDDETFERLEETVELGSFAVSPGRLVDLDDRYLDTDDYRVLSAGYFCRRRESQDGIVMTFKGLSDGDGAVHRREEVSVELEVDGPPPSWPDGPARELALRLAGDRPLETLFGLRQQRLERAVARGGRTVAELALDRVTIDTQRGSRSFLESEIELRPGGTERDLDELIAVVRARWGLEPVAQSKFARGLALATGVPLDRTEDWQRELRRLRVQRWVRRTRYETGASTGYVTGPAASEGSGGPASRPAPQEPESHLVESAERGEQRAVPQVSVLAAVDRRGAGGAESETSEAEEPEAAVAEPEEPQPEAPEPETPEPTTPGAEEPEAEVVESEEPEAEVAEPEEPEAAEPEAREPEEAVTEAEAEEPEVAEAEAAAAGEPEEAEHKDAALEGDAAEAKKKERARPGIVSDDTMDEAARKTLLFHYERMLKHEPGTREGDDAEELHDMRVATRRMRAALRVFDGYVDRATIKPYLKALRRTGRTLGTVRDLDVFYEKTQRYLQSLPEGHQDDLEPLLVAWRARRDEARAVMIDYLDSAAFARFTRRFGEFLDRPGAGAVAPFTADGGPLPRHVRDALPVVLFERLAAVRAFDEWVGGQDVPLTRYHRLRIASKGLRYTLEFFEEVLGAGANPLIEHVKTLQDHLGDLQDAVVGCGVAGAFLTWGTWQAPGAKCRGPAHPVLNAPGVATYLAHRQQEIATLIETFPPVWERVGGPEFARGVAGLVAGL